MEKALKNSIPSLDRVSVNSTAPRIRLFQQLERLTNRETGGSRFWSCNRSVRSATDGILNQAAREVAILDTAAGPCGWDCPRFLGPHGFRASRQWNYQFLDAYLKYSASGKAGTNAAVVDIDDISLSAAGQWPWPRYRTAALMQAVADAEPAAIGLIFCFPSLTDLVEEHPKFVQTGFRSKP
ncbi:MAG: CHASE2 domain-containing protein [Propionivibrio sp.]|nr:CHASE2 domain-containing protein [Propionivibrio sp.]